MHDSNNHKVPNAESIWPICENELNLGKHSSLLSQHGEIKSMRYKMFQTPM